MELHFDWVEKFILFVLFALDILFFYWYAKEAKRIGFWFLPSSLILFSYVLKSIFPALYFSKKLKKSQELQLNFSRKIQIYVLLLDLQIFNKKKIQNTPQYFESFFFE